MLNLGHMHSFSVLQPGASLLLPSGRSPIDQNIWEVYVKPLVGQTAAISRGLINEKQFLEMLTLYQQLDPPKYLKNPRENNPDTMIARR